MKMKKIFIPALAVTACLASCTRDFLNPDGMSFYEPEATYTSESGLMSSMAICDRHLKNYYAHDHGEMTPIGTEYMFSDLMVASNTDKTAMLCDVASALTPTSESGGNHLNRSNSIDYHWNETFNGIKYANTILAYVDDIETMNEETKNTYKGRAYFHRAFRYYNLVFQFGDVPLVTKLPSVPKQNYRSTSRDAILEMLRQDMEFAVQWVPDQSAMSMRGMINKGACRMLLAKIYLALGEYQKAIEQTDALINNSGYSLITSETYGEWVDSSVPETWPVTRNVIWDMHRAQNKTRADNTEAILTMINRGAQKEAMEPLSMMRWLYPFILNGNTQATTERKSSF